MPECSPMGAAVEMSVRAMLQGPPFRTLHLLRPYSLHDSKYGLRICRGDSQVHVVVTELVDNPGVSITNNWEQLAPWIALHCGILEAEWPKIRWFERYWDRPEAIDEVVFQSVDLARPSFERPIWKRVGLL